MPTDIPEGRMQFFCRQTVQPIYHWFPCLTALPTAA